MKIRVQGTTIDTEDIRSISEIEINFRGGISFLFLVDLADSRELEVRHYISSEEIYITTENRVCFKSQLYTEGTPFSSNSAAIEYVKLLPLYKEEYNKIKTLYDSVIAYWSNNQSKIPNLEII